MANIIDQLVVTLDLDSSRFEAAMKKASYSVYLLNKVATQASKSIQQAGGAHARVLQKQAEQAARGIAAAAQSARPILRQLGNTGAKAGDKINAGMRRGGFGALSMLYIAIRLNKALGFPMLHKMAERVIQAEASTARLSTSLRLNAQELQAWQMVIERHGGTREAFDNSLGSMTVKLGKLGTNLRGAKLVGLQLGLAGVTEQMIKSKDALAVFQLFARQMQSMSTNRQVEVGKGLGLDRATVQALQEGGPALIEQLEATRKLAATQKELNDARQVAIAQTQLSQVWERVEQLVIAALLPALRKLIAMLTGIAQWAREHQKLVAGIFIAIATALSLFVAIAAAAAANFALLQITASSAMLLGIGPLAIGIAAIVLGLGYLVTQLGYTRDGMNEVRDAATGMKAAVTGGAGHGEKFKRDEARRISIENYNAFKRKEEARLGQLAREQAGIPESHDLQTLIPKGIRDASGISAATALSAAIRQGDARKIDHKMAKIHGDMASAAANFAEFLRRIKKEDGQVKFDALRHGAGKEALHTSLEAARAATTQIGTVNINVGTVQDAVSTLGKIGQTFNVMQTGGGGLPGAASVGGGMNG